MSQVSFRMRSSSDVDSLAVIFFLLGNEFLKCERKTIRQHSYFGSYFMRDRRRAFLSMVRLMVSVSLALCCIGIGLVLAELPEPADVIVCEAVKRFPPPRFDSSNALRASCVKDDGVDLAGKSWRTAEFAVAEDKIIKVSFCLCKNLRLKALWNRLECLLSDICVT